GDRAGVWPQGGPRQGGVEAGQGWAGRGAAGEALPPPRYALERGVDLAIGEVARDAGQARAEDEQLDVAHALPNRVKKLQQHPRVALHRAGNVAEQDELAPLLLALAAVPPEQPAGGAA